MPRLIYQQLILALAFLISPSFVVAEDFRRLGQGIRNLGMGNVGIALSHDENALQYNPAGLAGVDSAIVSIIAAAEASTDYFKLFTDLQAAGASDDSNDLYVAALGKRLHARAMAGAHVIVPFGGEFTFGANSFSEFAFDVLVQNPVLFEANLGFRFDQVQSVGAAIPIGKGHWVFGFGLRSVNRIELPPVKISLGTVAEVGTSEEALADEYGSPDKVASGQGIDLGFHRRIETGDGFRMTFGMVAQNVTGLTFARNGGRILPEDRPAEFSVGFSLQPELLGGFMRVLYSVDIRDLTSDGTSDSSLQKRLHSGAELGFLPIDSTASFFAVRAGYNQGYLSYGAEINPFIFLRIVTLQVAIYTQEMGEDVGKNPEERISFQASVAF